MKKLFLALALCVGLTGCVVEGSVYDSTIYHGSVEFCDDYGCRWVDAPYYYYGDEVVYWDSHFGCWIGPSGYWLGGIYYRGAYPGYHGWYHYGRYHAYPHVVAPHYYYHSVPHFRR